MPLDRELYYSQTECLKVLKVSVKRFKMLMAEKGIKPIEVEVKMNYTIICKYYLKEEIDKIN